MPTRKKKRLSAPTPAEPGDRVLGPPDDSPLSFIEDERERIVAAGHRATDSISWALNAQLEVANYKDRDLCYQRATILDALHIASSSAELLPLTRSATKLLAAKGRRPIVPGRAYELGQEASDMGTRRRFLETTRDFLLEHLEENERAVDSVRSYDAVLAAANSQEPVPDTPRQSRAQRIAEAIINELYLDVAYASLHPRALLPSNLKEVTEQTARAIAFLMERERATPVNVAFVTLVLLGRSPRDRRNLFSAKVTDPVADVGASVRLIPR